MLITLNKEIINTLSETELRILSLCSPQQTKITAIPI